ncbi:two component transcriptional regulator [Candidatus Magnetobacterium bavaricum]|uniref:Two component transcriptional regulator n=1 Tax=Candidatus Magnetobacterium bavaricum TaxID=29290 RepID=A0A0F3GKL1_9BACT|nr:two component transcriptional regulator [Candidatus Magnetobacterium bavaricum]
MLFFCIDDEKIAIDNLSHVMKKEGYEVTTTQSSVRALTLLEGGRFDVVLTDLKMEKVDGMPKRSDSLNFAT